MQSFYYLFPPAAETQLSKCSIFFRLVGLVVVSAAEFDLLVEGSLGLPPLGVECRDYPTTAGVVPGYHTKTPITAFHFQHFWMVTANDPGRSNTNGQHSATEHDQKVQKPAGFNLNLPGSFFSRACKTWKQKRDTSWLVVSRFFFSVL